MADAEPDAALLRAIRERLTDDEPRLVYADLLSQRGNPLGELIAVQCAMARLDREDVARRPLEQRQNALLAAHRDAWLGMLASLPSVSAAYITRGFVERIAIPEPQFAEHAAAIFDAAPLLADVFLVGDTRDDAATSPPAPVPELARLDGVHFPTADSAVAALASPHLARLRRLELDRDFDAPRIVDALVRHDLPRLEVLDVGSIAIGRQGLERLAGADRLGRLRRLHVPNCGIDRVDALAAATALRHLWIQRNPLGTDGARALLTAPALAGLEELILDETGAGDAIAATTLPGLRILGYRQNGLTPATARAVAASTTFGTLERLALTGTNRAASALDVASVVALVTARELPRLTALQLDQNPWGRAMLPIAHALRPGFRELELRWTGLDAEVVGALAGNANLASVERLVLAHNRFFDEGAMALAASPHLRPRVLDLSFVELGHDGFAALANSPVLADVRTLTLDDCELDDRDMEVLARSPMVGNLLRLWLSGNAITDRGARALAASPHLPPLLYLALGATRITARGRAALVGAGHTVAT